MPAEHEPPSEMNMMATGAKKGARRLVGNLTGLFAIIGAAAAVIQIIQAFNHDAPEIKAELRSSASFIPEGSRVTLSPEEDAIWNVSKNDAIKHYCDRRTHAGEVNYFRDDANCEKVKSVSFKVDRSISYGSN